MPIELIETKVLTLLLRYNDWSVISCTTKIYGLWSLQMLPNMQIDGLISCDCNVCTVFVSTICLYETRYFDWSCWSVTTFSWCYQMRFQRGSI